MVYCGALQGYFGSVTTLRPAEGGEPRHRGLRGNTYVRPTITISGKVTNPPCPNDVTGETFKQNISTTQTATQSYFGYMAKSSSDAKWVVSQLPAANTMLGARAETALFSSTSNKPLVARLSLSGTTATQEQA